MRVCQAVGGWMNAPLRFTKSYDSNEQAWFVTTRFLRDHEPPIELGREPLEDFPSEMLIAQCMLVCQ